MSESAGWPLPADYQALRDTVRDFMDREVRVVEQRLPHDSHSVPAELLAPLQEKARRSGLWCVESPAAYGGAGLSALGVCVVREEASKCDMGAYVPACGAFGWDPPSAIFGGTDEQIKKYAVPAIEQGQRCFIALSEPSGGSDPGRAIQTRATYANGAWTLNGTKSWISHAGTAPWGVIFARTNDQPGGKGISAFIVDMSSPGITTRPIPVIRSDAPYEIFLDDCKVPEQNLLGPEGGGFSIGKLYVERYRVQYAAGVVGVAQAALDIALRYAVERQVFGSALADKQAIQWMLADSEIELRAARQLVYAAAIKADSGEAFQTDASVAKVFATEVAGTIVDRCIQILGGMGVAREMPLERWYRELRIKRIGEGPSEVHRMLIARSLIRSARSGAPPSGSAG